MDIERIDKVLKETKGVNLVVASKYVDSNGIRNLYSLGLKNYGENRVDAFLEKYNSLQDLDITWHFIGHLQKNKAKKVVDKISYLHSLDSLELASLIEKYANKPVKCFIEIHSTDSETKDGILPENLQEFLTKVKEFKKVEVIGLMTMSDKEQTDEEKEEVFRKLKELGNKFNLQEFSMGMSNDYKLAIKEGATFIRLGRIICK